MVDADGTTPLPYDAARGVYPTSYAVRLLPPLAAFGADDPSARFRALLTDLRGEALNNYIYGMMRTALVRRGPLFEPYVGADKVLLSRMILAGRFIELPDELFIWRHHAGEFGFQRHRDAARIWNPRSTGRLSSMAARQLGGYANAIMSARLTPAQKAACFLALGLKVPHGLVRKTQRRWQGRRSTPGIASGDHGGVG